MRLAAVAVLFGISSPAAADIDARRMVRALSRAQKVAPGAIARAPLSGSDGRLPILVRLAPGESASKLGLLEVAPGFATARLTPLELEAFSLLHPDRVPTITPPRRALIDVSGTWTAGPDFRAATGIDGTGVVVGIIDTGLDVTHPDFLDAEGKTRVAWLMVRDTPKGFHPGLETTFGCNAPKQSPCAIYSAAELDALIATAPLDTPTDIEGHGTHVASIATSNGGISIVNNPRYVGMAPGATLIIVSPSAGGGFSDPDILRATQFIFDRAAALGMPAVVNISLGSDFGPHDGTSALEQGLAAMVGDANPGRAIVVAAGNSGALYRIEEHGPFGVHTEVHASPNAIKRVPLRTAGGDGKIDGAGFVWVTFRPGDEVSVGLEGPDGEELVALVAPGDESGYDGDDLRAGIINGLVNDKSSLTADTNGAVVFFEGKWDAKEPFAILVRGRGDAQLWVTGVGEAAPGRGGLGLLFDKALKTGTVAVPASHPGLIAVGCTLNRIDWRPYYLPAGQGLGLAAFGGMDPPLADSVCYFSGAGPTPTGHPKPDIVAPGAFVAGAVARDADPLANPFSMFQSPICPEPDKPCLLVDTQPQHGLTSGTSMSSPQVAGAAALLLQLDPTLTQREILEILQAGARRPSGVVDYDYQMGPGALDMIGALQVVEERVAGDRAALGASYYVLSSPYARPDPSWPVHGTVELRHADGQVLMTPAGDDLELRIDGGVVITPIAQVRAGLYRFAFSAPKGSGGETVEVDVRYRGASLGVRILPIGVDIWAAQGGVRPVGGCQIGRPETRGEWGLVALGLWLARRRRGPRRGLRGERA
jgi:subtilisin family serine protease